MTPMLGKIERDVKRFRQIVRQPPSRSSRPRPADVMPLLLYLKGFPQAADLPGTLPTAAPDASLLSRQPPRRVATYGDRYSPRPAGGTREADAEMLERLRALGYLQ